MSWEPQRGQAGVSGMSEASAIAEQARHCQRAGIISMLSTAPSAMVPLVQMSKQKRRASGKTPESAPQATLMARMRVACSAAAAVQARSTIVVIKASSCTGGRIEVEKFEQGGSNAGGGGEADALGG